ncbi:amidase signature enzyme [Eremomyces bilateralis CBS 781.70]|uniref:Amidase signature enzyme n=1 Tax=Eremomyces bilateralis CBS 781.70 TaxID=1392243 RepID=A0A6G1GCL4_9PEZI|nr:amidase signature enzyme [Eremomyces bilateralis CBS 781.70]KAF1815656.1 amidase signature enzyme [Eremomyces bilateralis CBS 781.70]
MSVLFTTISEKNPVTVNDVCSALAKVGGGVKPRAEDEADFVKLLAACHDCAASIDALPDYDVPTDGKRFPRKNVHRVQPSEQVLGAAWAHTFSIKDDFIQGPLSGKTVCLKDCICVAGVPQILGTEIIEPWEPTSDATVVTRTLEAGGEIVGTANCENWCQSTSSFSSAHGTVENPHAAGYSAGGSTSGASALVGAGLVDIAIGADQGGSIRVPAALCGCVGLKPTFGLVPYTGIASNDAINDHAGPLASNTMDTALCLDAISGYDGIDDRCFGAPKPSSTTFAADLAAPSAADLRGFRIGILKEAFEQATVEPRMKTAVLSAANRFKELGATVAEVSVPDHNLGTAIWTIQQRIAGSLSLLGHTTGRRGQGLPALHAARLPWTQEKFDKCFPTTQNTMLNGLYLMERFPSIYAKTLNLIRRLTDSYDRVLKDYDVLILPTTPFVAPRHGTLTTPIATIEPTVGLTCNTAMFDATGHPALTLPVGWLSAKDNKDIYLPVGMQVIGGMWEDGKVLRAAYVWEQSFDWKAMKPVVNGMH